jgi:Putative Actinobacterial Holin-X, holin superfamily III
MSNSMARERLKQSSLPETFSQVLGDLADLFRKELRLARAELSSNASAKLRGGIWLALAGIFGLASLALVLGALVAWITSLDVSLHVAFLIVAAGVGLLAVIAYFAGQKDAQAELTPSRTISQVKRDIEITKEQLT